MRVFLFQPFYSPTTHKVRRFIGFLQLAVRLPRSHLKRAALQGLAEPFVQTAIHTPTCAVATHRLVVLRPYLFNLTGVERTQRYFSFFRN